VVGGVVLALVIWTVWMGWKRWQAAAYRRAALAELQRLTARAADDTQREFALRELPELVKRTALAAFPRQQVASLSDASWLEFLDRTGHTDAFTHGQGKWLPALAYDPHAAGRLDVHEADALCSVISHWIRGHSARLKTP
jgi:hypothetical protein